MGQFPIRTAGERCPGQRSSVVGPPQRPAAERARLRWPAIPLPLAASLLLLAPLAPGWAQANEAAALGQPTESGSDAPSNAAQLGLADHLRRQGYVFYGAWWCPACRQQKSLFGQPAVQRLPYLECEKEEAGRQRCNAMGIRAYPTWIKGGERREGVLTLEELKRWSGYRPGAATPAGANP